MNPLEELLTVEELAAMCRVPRRTIYQWQYSGTGPKALRVGRYLRFRASDVSAWLDEQADHSAA